MPTYFKAFAVLAAACALLFFVAPLFEGQARGAIEIGCVALFTVGVFMPLASAWQRRGC